MSGFSCFYNLPNAYHFLALKDFKTFNFLRYELITPREVQMGFRLANGSWTGVLGLLQRGVISIFKLF